MVHVANRLRHGKRPGSLDSERPTPAPVHAAAWRVIARWGERRRRIPPLMFVGLPIH